MCLRYGIMGIRLEGGMMMEKWSSVNYWGNCPEIGGQSRKITLSLAGVVCTSGKEFLPDIEAFKCDFSGECQYILSGKPCPVFLQAYSDFS